MAITLLRIDDRLIHGQVVEGWLNKLDIKTIVVANDLVAEDIMQKTLMQMAIPSNIDIVIESIDNVLSDYKLGKFEEYKTLLLVSCPQDAYRLINGGIKIESVNVGGMHLCEGKCQILEFLSVNEEDCKYFNLIAKENIKIEGRPLPDFDKIDIVKNICKIQKM
jgi:PTS system mannose-specific IIB component